MDEPLTQSNTSPTMETVVTPPATAPAQSSAAGWVIAVILLLALIGAAAYMWMGPKGAPASESAPVPEGGAANINVTLPPAPVGDKTDSTVPPQPAQ